MNREETIRRQDVLDLAKKGILISNGNYESVCKAINELPSVNPQPCGDAIDRNIVCAFIDGLISDDGERKKGLEYIRNMPAVNPTKTGQWIPVSERLPKKKETVLVTFKHFVSGNTIGLGSVILLRGKLYYWYVRGQNLGTYDVLAWMPLPAPYDSQESEG